MNLANLLRPLDRSTFDLLRLLALCVATDRDIDPALRALHTDRAELAALVRLLASTRGADAVVDLGQGVGVRSFAELLRDVEALEHAAGAQARARREALDVGDRERAFARRKRDVLRHAVRG